MKIELEEPFKSKWKYGYLRNNNDGRKILDLYNSDKNRTTVSYARYLMSVKLGYEVPDYLQVDHVDNDKTNDSLDNLQLLTSEENITKEANRYIEEEQIFYGYECANCNDRFILAGREVKNRLYQNIELAFCSRSCSVVFRTNNGQIIPNIGKTISEDKIKQIKELSLQKLSSYKIANIVDVSRNTVMKYW